MPTIITKPGGRFMARARVAGFNPISKVFSNRKDAHRWADAEEQRLRNAKDKDEASDDIGTVTLARLINVYLEDPEVRKLKSFAAVQQRLEWFSDKFGAVKVARFGRKTLNEAKRKMLAAGHGPATVNRYLAVVRSVFSWGQVNDLVMTDRVWPGERLMLSEPPGRIRFLSDGERKALLDAVGNDKVMRAAILISIGTGVREGELLRLTWGDLDLSDTNPTLTVHVSKSGKPRKVAIPLNVVTAIKALGRGTPAAPLLTNSKGRPMIKTLVEYRWLAIRKRAKLEDFRWHDLRHTAASYFAQAGASLLEIGSMLGHASPSMTQRYSHLVSGKAITGADKVNAMLK